MPFITKYQARSVKISHSRCRITFHSALLTQLFQGRYATSRLFKMLAQIVHLTQTKIQMSLKAPLTDR